MMRQLQLERRTVVVFTLFVVSLFATDIRASVVSVGCPGSSGTFDFTSVNDAVGSLAGAGTHDHALIISGTFKEVIFLRDLDNLLLIGTTGAWIFGPSDPGG